MEILERDTFDGRDLAPVDRCQSYIRMLQVQLRKKSVRVRCVFFQKTFPQNCLSSPEVISLLKKRRGSHLLRELMVGTDFGQQKR